MRKIWWLALPLLMIAAACSDGDDDDKSDKKDDDAAEDTEASDDSDDSDGSDDSSGSGGDSRDDYVAALVESMGEDDSFGTDEANECVSGAVVDVIGLENLQGKVTPDELAEADDLAPLGVSLDAGSWWDKANECTDMDIWLMTTTAGGDEVVAQCFIENTTAEQRRAIFVAGSDGSDPQDASAALRTATEICVTTTETTVG